MRIFKKPLFWTILAAVIAVAAGTVIWVAIPSARFPKNASVRIRDTGSDVDGIVFEVRSVHVERGSLRFDLRWKNDSGNDISFGSFFELYKSESGKWVKMPQVRAVGYNDIAYMLNSGSTRDQTFDITAPYNLRSVKNTDSWRSFMSLPIRIPQNKSILGSILRSQKTLPMTVSFRRKTPNTVKSRQRKPMRRCSPAA